MRFFQNSAVSTRPDSASVKGATRLLTRLVVRGSPRRTRATFSASSAEPSSNAVSEAYHPDEIEHDQAKGDWQRAQELAGVACEREADERLERPQHHACRPDGSKSVEFVPEIGPRMNRGQAPPVHRNGARQYGDGHEHDGGRPPVPRPSRCPVLAEARAAQRYPREVHEQRGRQHGRFRRRRSIRHRACGDGRRPSSAPC